MFLKILIFCLVLVSLGACQSQQSRYRTIDASYHEAHLDPGRVGLKQTPCCEAKGETLAVASGGTFASQAALEIYKKGGNVIDAAVTVAFMIAVERPSAAGIGGGGFMTVHLQDEAGPQQHFIDFRETAPAKATRNMYLDKKGEVVPKLSVDGGLAVGTPGFVAGMWEIHQKWGKLKWSEVLQPAIELAEQGFPITSDLATRIDYSQDRLNHRYARRLLFKKGKPRTKGSVFVQRDLAKTIRLLARDGKKAFYEGEVGNKMVRFLKKQKGILSQEDLKRYQVGWRKPLRWKHDGFEFISAPPPSAGGVAMAQMYHVLSGFDLVSQATNIPAYYHLLAEVMSGAFADRSYYIGDPAFSELPYQLLLTDEYADRRRGKLDLEAHLPSAKVRPGKVEFREANNTSHFSLMDREGNTVSCTLTVNLLFGSGLAVPGVGFFLNNEMDDFSVKPGTQNAFGLTGGEANAIAPGKRPVSSMAPTVVLKNSKPVLALGAAGGSRIITSVFQVSLNHLYLYRRDLRRAVTAPRIHFQWVPDVLYYENGGLRQSNLDALISRGFGVERSKHGLARVNAVGVGRSGELFGVTDPRDSGGAEAY